MFKWNSNQYLKFESERTQPSIDLANRIKILHPINIIDIGCGPGNSTQVLCERYPDSKVLGVDMSDDMIKTARETHDNAEFMVCDVEREIDKISEKYDIVFSNACIQWIPNHELLLKNMMNLLNEGGALAVQIPMNYNEPIHKIIRNISTNEKWAKKFNKPRLLNTLTESEYFDLLSGISSDFVMWNTVYMHRMKDHNAIMDWYRGTGLRPYLQQLSDDDKLEFENDIYNEVIKSYPKQKNGELIFRFPRFFFIAIK